RVLLRRSSDTRGIDDLAVDRRYGGLFDDQAPREAVTDYDVVYYCVVDARMWLRDPAALFSTNVDGLRHVLDAALAVGVRKFVFPSTVRTAAGAGGRARDE